MTTIIFGIVGFLLQAMALKIALGILGQSASDNRYSKAIGIALLLTVAGWFIGFLPFPIEIGLYSLLWLGVIMGSYRIGFFRSLGVAVLQVGVKAAIGLVLSLIGFPIASLFG